MRFPPPSDDARKWHRWFAWYPVETADHTIIWLEIVERRADPQQEAAILTPTPFGFTYVTNWQYRAVKR